MTTFDDTHAALASRMRQARERAELSQGEVARRLGMHRPSISWIESGERNVLAVELVIFARLYGVSVLWLLGLDGEGVA
jgi:transcriptional regulator with XRE-family HTH domain